VVIIKNTSYIPEAIVFPQTISGFVRRIGKIGASLGGKKVQNLEAGAGTTSQKLGKNPYNPVWRRLVAYDRGSMGV